MKREKKLRKRDLDGIEGIKKIRSDFVRFFRSVKGFSISNEKVRANTWLLLLKFFLVDTAFDEKTC